MFNNLFSKVVPFIR